MPVRLALTADASESGELGPAWRRWIRIARRSEEGDAGSESLRAPVGEAEPLPVSTTPKPATSGMAVTVAGKPSDRRSVRSAPLALDEVPTGRRRSGTRRGANGPPPRLTGRAAHWPPPQRNRTRRQLAAVAAQQDELLTGRRRGRTGRAAHRPPPRPNRTS